jgi:hypothetical protein
MSYRIAMKNLYTLFSVRDLSRFRPTASVEGHTRREAGPQSHSSCKRTNAQEGWAAGQAAEDAGETARHFRYRPSIDR